jgi:hypothetical protein
MRVCGRRGRALRAGGGLLAALLALAPASSVLHNLVVRHGTCAEHGEPVDLTAAAAAPDADWSHAAATAHLAPGAPAAEHEHEHCAVAAHARENASPPRPTVTLLSPPALATETIPLPVLTHGPAPLLLAPKHSPPSCA